MKTLKYNKFTGLHIVCKKCNKHIEVTSAPYKGCNHPYDRQKYKAIIKLNGYRKTRDLKSLNYDEDVKELLDFKSELYNTIKLINLSVQPEIKFELFTDFMYMFGD